MDFQTINLQEGKVVPGAPFGILGGFIKKKLQDYVEPERAGTPRGEPIGFSRKKFHAILLSLTNIDLRKQAKVVGVSYGLLRKWRTEKAFLDCSLQFAEEFTKGPFDMAAFASFQVWGDPASTIKGIDAASISATQRLLGLEDASLYSPPLSILILNTWFDKMDAAGKAGWDISSSALDWVRSLDHLLRQTGIGKEHVEFGRRTIARRLAQLQHQVYQHPSTKDRRMVINGAAMLINDILKD